MTGSRFFITIHVPGTQAANLEGSFKVPSGLIGATLIGVSLSGSNANDATFDLGDADDPNGVLAAVDFGDSHTPAAYGRNELNGALVTAGQEYHFSRDDVIQWAVDFDGSSGTAIDDVTIVMEFAEG